MDTIRLTTKDDEYPIIHAFTAAGSARTKVTRCHMFFFFFFLLFFFFFLLMMMMMMMFPGQIF